MRLLLTGLAVLAARLLAGAELIVLCTSDIHGQWGEDGSGWPRIAAILKAERAAAGDTPLLLIDCGDEFSGSYQVYRSGGEFGVAAMNLLGYDFWIPGNHDFDFGAERLLELLEHFDGRMLACNWEAVPGAARIDFDGFSVNLVGLTTETLPWYAMRPEGLPSIERESAALARTMASLAPAEVTIIAMHRGIYGRNGHLFDLLAPYPEADLVLGGHSHVVEAGKRIRDSHFIAPGGHGEGVTKAVLHIDEETGRVAGITSCFLPADETVPPDPEFTAAMESLFPPDPVDVFHGAVDPAPERAAKRFYASSAGTLILKTLELPESVPMATVSTRPKSYPAEMTDRNIYELFPYNDQAVSATLTREELIAVLNEQIALSRKHPQVPVVGNLQVTADAEWRITAVEPIREEYLLVTTSFIAAGAGGRAPAIHEIFRSREVTFHGDLRDRLKALLRPGEPLDIAPANWLTRDK